MIAAPGEEVKDLPKSGVESAKVEAKPAGSSVSKTFPRAMLNLRKVKQSRQVQLSQRLNHLRRKKLRLNPPRKKHRLPNQLRRLRLLRLLLRKCCESRLWRAAWRWKIRSTCSKSSAAGLTDGSPGRISKKPCRQVRSPRRLLQRLVFQLLPGWCSTNACRQLDTGSTRSCRRTSTG